ncbi:hypothetical protein H4W30_000595 [Amycolatopsis roodepoortensis]|uniref:Uncharacterized protein n=1 Tax=Amycolatopsis roodepoortensis TaxID=700274 RepID=A0ABR9KZM8_9PSEU|nr:hypothetical protein [Amycolatopsis roodepoortensis]
MVVAAGGGTNDLSRASRKTPSLFRYMNPLNEGIRSP